MIPTLSLFLGLVAIASTSPIEVRTVASLNQAAFEEAQQKDTTATRAFSATQIKTSDGKCLFVDELSGDFRANLNPIQVAACDGSVGQQWDIITKGKHDDQAGTMLVVNALTQACMNFDPRRAAGNTVIMFSCGGRADGGGAVTNSQLFNFTSGSGPLALQPLNAVGTCLAVTAGNVLDQAPCSAADANQSFTFGGAATETSVSAPASSSALSTTSLLAITTSSASPIAVSSNILAPSSDAACIQTTVVTVTRAPSSVVSEPSVVSSATSAVSSSAASSAIATTAAAVSEVDANPTTPVPVSRAGGVLQPSAAAESNQRDNTATRAGTSVSIKSSSGQCLVIDPTAGDFRQNLIPVQVQDCTGSAGEKFDLITKGIHNDQANSTLLVSSLTQGCVSFDDRRAAGDTVTLFSCGGRADGTGQVTGSQLFAFGGGSSLVLSPENTNQATCLVVKAGRLDQAPCSGDASQVFSIA